MPWNGSGVFSRNGGGLGLWVTQSAAGIKILSVNHDASDGELATGINTCLTKDGQNVPTANLPMGNFKHTGVAAAANLTDYARASDVQNNTPCYLTGVAGTNTITASAVYLMAAYVAGQRFEFIPANTNTGMTTINVNSIGAKDVYFSGAACAGGELVVGVPVTVVYDGTRFHVMVSTLNRQGFRNRVTNGDVSIDQRNGGAAVTVNADSNFFGPDMWRGLGAAADGVFTVAQSAATPPPGFTRFLRATVTTADASIGAAQSYRIITPFEGRNMADLDFGAAGAQTVTISFRVRSSLTGSFSGALRNGGSTRSYPFTFTINSASTWETKAIAIAGDTSGTWPTDNTAWGLLVFDLGSGTNFRGTAGAWAGSSLNGVTGAVSLISTLSATFDVTGVQLEAGPVATAFEQLDVGNKERRVSRYFQRMIIGETSDRQLAPWIEMYGYMSAGNTVQHTFPLGVRMRTQATGTRIGTWTLTGVSAQPTVTPSTASSVIFSSTKDGTTGPYQVSAGVGVGYTLAAEL